MEVGRSNSKGQVFVIAAVLFTSLAVLLFTAVDFTPDQTQDTVKEFYENVFHSSPEKLNQALKDNYSIRNARNEMYSYSRFVDRSSKSKGVEFGASYLIVLPQKGRAAFINYRYTKEAVKLYASSNGWTNTSVSSKQYFNKNFSPGKTSFQLIIPDRDINRSFTASNPRIFTAMRLSAKNQIWINSELN